MRMRTKLVLAALTATALLSMAVTSASSNKLSIDEKGFRITWTSLEFTEAVFGVRVLCPATLEGSFHSATISKVIGALVGNITKATTHTAACTGGRVSTLSETLPWHVHYDGFRGTLPNITSLTAQVVNPRFRLEVTGINCTSGAVTLTAIIETGFREVGGFFKIDNVTVEEGTSSTCGVLNGAFTGTGRATKLASASRVLLKLI